jgi:ligand-binding sensor domain-containing protein
MMHIILTLLSCFIYTHLSAQLFTNYTTADGLIDNNVLCIDIDTATNKLWVGTQNGLASYDGTQWHSFDTSSHPSLIDNQINTVFVASDQRVWLGTDYGICVWNDTVFVAYTTADGLGNNRVNCIAEGSDGTLWIGEFSGLSKFDGSQFVTYNNTDGLPFGGIKQISFGANNHLYMASALGGLVEFDGTNIMSISSSQGLLSNVTRAVQIDNQQRIWVGTAAGVSVVDTQLNLLANHTIMYQMPPPDTLNPVEDVAIDGQGRVWAAIYVDYLLTVGGIAFYDGQQWIDYDVSDGLIGPVVRQIEVDVMDHVWVGTSSGLSKISMVPNATTTLQKTQCDLKVYPNPVTDILTIERTIIQESASTIRLFGSDMRCLKQYNLPRSQQKKSICVKHHCSGLYFLALDSNFYQFIIR